MGERGWDGRRGTGEGRREYLRTEQIGQYLLYNSFTKQKKK